MKSAVYDIDLEQGATFKLPMQWQDSDGVPIDLTGISFSMKIRPTKDSAVVILEGAYDGTANDPTGDIYFQEYGPLGTFSITIRDVILANLDFTQAVYDIEASTNDTTWRLIEGVVRFSKEVTRE